MQASRQRRQSVTAVIGILTTSSSGTSMRKRFVALQSGSLTLMPSKSAKAKSVDDYLARLDADQRAALERLRANIRAAIPKAEECISYGVPAFRLDGKVVAWYGAAKNHCSFYPGGIVGDFQDELAEFETRKGTIHFHRDHPIPAALVRKLVKAQLARRTKN